MNTGAFSTLRSRSMSHDVGKRCEAWTRPPTNGMMPYQVLIACAAHGLLVRAQEVAPTLIPASA